MKDEVEALRRATREAHEAMQGLRDARRELVEERSKLDARFAEMQNLISTERDRIARAVQDIVRTIVRAEVKVILPATRDAMRKVEDQMLAKFEEFAELLFDRELANNPDLLKLIKPGGQLDLPAFRPVGPKPPSALVRKPSRSPSSRIW